ncbi:MAG: DMT family transporter, partial [Selenomonas massiliensis]
MQGQVHIYFYAVSAVVIWSTLAAMAKSLLTVIPTFEALFLSSLIASVFLLVQQGVRGGLRVFRAYDWRGYLAMAVLGFIGLFVYSGLYFYGLTQLTSQEACILNYLWPMMIVLFAALLLGERITLRTAVALFLSFSGVLVLTLGGEGRADGNAVLGSLACVLAALCYGLFCVLNRKRNVDP